jgi:hypothetical protein
MDRLHLALARELRGEERAYFDFTHFQTHPCKGGRMEEIYADGPELVTTAPAHSEPRNLSTDRTAGMSPADLWAMLWGPGIHELYCHHQGPTQIWIPTTSRRAFMRALALGDCYVSAVPRRERGLPTRWGTRM